MSWSSCSWQINHPSIIKHMFFIWQWCLGQFGRHSTSPPPATSYRYQITNSIYQDVRHFLVLTGQLIVSTCLLSFFCFFCFPLASPCWNENSIKSFQLRIALAYELLLKQSGQWEASWPWKMIWKTKAPVKVACFWWIATWGACNKLHKRGFVLCHRCDLCRKN